MVLYSVEADVESTKSLGALYADLGHGLLRAGRYEESVTALRKAIQEGGEDFPRAQAYLALGRTYGALNRPAEAAEAFAQAVKLDATTLDSVASAISTGATTPEAPPRSSLAAFLQKFGVSKAPPAFRYLGWELLAGGEFASAEQLLRSVLRSSPKDADALEQLGRALLSQESPNLPEAERIFRLALAVEPKRASALVGLAETLARSGKPDEARGLLTRVRELEVQDARTFLEAGKLWRTIQQLDESRADLERAVRLDTSDPRIWHELAATQEAQGQPGDAATSLLEEARLLLDRGALSDAEAACRRATRLDPRGFDGFVLFGKVLLAAGHPTRARRELEHAVDIAATPDALVTLAYACYEARESERALQAVDRALSLDGGHVDALLLKARIRSESGLYQEALEDVNTVLAKDSEHHLALVSQGSALAGLGKTTEAIASLRKAVAQTPEDGFANAALGLLLNQQEGGASEALVYLDAALGQDPGNHELLLARGRALLSLNQMGEAKSALEALLRDDPANADAARYLGAAQLGLNLVVEAISTLQLAIDLDAAASTQDSQTYAQLGDALRLANRLDEAQAAFVKALELSSGAPDRWTLAHYGETLRAMGQAEKALEPLRRAVELRPDDWWALGSLGAAQCDMHLLRSALASLNKSVELNPGYSWTLAFKGLVHASAGQYDTALGSFDRALQTDPGASWILVEKAVTLVYMRANLDQALALFKQALAQNPKYERALAFLGDCLYYLDQFEECVDTIDQALALSPEVFLWNATRSLALSKLGKEAESEAASEQALGGDATQLEQPYLNRGRRYSMLGAYQLATTDFLKAHELSPDSAAVSNSHAWMYIERVPEKLDEGIELAQTAVRNLRQDTPAELAGLVLDTLGWGYYRRGEYHRALDLLQQARERWPEGLVIDDHYEESARAAGQQLQADAPSPSITDATVTTF